MEQSLEQLYRNRIQSDVKNIVRVIVNAGLIRRKLPPSVWASEFINFKYDHSARIKDKINLNLTPYLVDPINAWDFTGTIREVTVCAPEQTGKTLSWVIGLLWSFIYNPCLSLVCYESDNKAAEINKDKLLPLMKAIPELAAELSIPKSFRSDRYSFSNLTSYFQGAGSRISSKSSRVNVADEQDDWQEHDNQVDNIQDMRKRLRSFDESILYKVCTVKGSSPKSKGGSGVRASRIWGEFLNSSQGYWYLACQNKECKSQQWRKFTGLTMRSCDVHNLQFKIDKENNLTDGSCRLVCPICGFEHAEKLKPQMNLQGGYIHKKPERLKGKFVHFGFQWGALASPWETLGWEVVAKLQIKAGKTGRIEEQIFFDNSIRGLPFKMRKVVGKQENLIREHCADAPPCVDEIEAILVSADTQDYGWKWEVRALDVNSCRWQIAYGFSEYLELSDEKREEINEQRKAECLKNDTLYKPIKTLEDVIYNDYFASEDFKGITPLIAIIDAGGHRAREVMPFASKHRKVFGYKGDNRGNQRIKRSKDQPKLILAKAKEFQVDMLYYIYYQTNRENYYWYLLPDKLITSEYVAEIAAMRRDTGNKAEGHLLEKYVHNNRMHDYFDTGKMYFALEEFAVKALKKSSWRVGKAEILNIKQKKQSNPEATEPEPKTTTQPETKSSWMNGY